jgi:asparagine synthase (glutamine-hydrolysing)
MTSLVASASNRVGDVVVAFHTGAPKASRDVSIAWAVMADNLDWRLWQQLSTSSWKGFPLTQFKTEAWHILLLGEVYNNSGAPSELEQFVREIVCGERDAKELNGHFLLWAWNEKRRQWHVWTDRFGTLHAYHAHYNGSAALGTCSSTVTQLASRRRLDSHSLTGFFGFGFFPQDRTFFEDVRILRPATHYVFSAAGAEISAERYWNWRHEPDTKRSYEDTVGEFGGVFATVMRDQLREGLIAVPISGGLDSRCTVATINGSDTQSSNLWFYSYGYSGNSVETKIARQVASARGLPMEAFTTRPYLFEQMGRVLACVEGFQDVTQCRQAAVTQDIAAHADFVITAHWGDVWLDTMGLAGENSGHHPPSSAFVVDHALKKMAKKGRAWLLENICAPKLGQEKPEGVLQQFVAEGMKPLQYIEDPDFRMKAYKTDNWSFRWTVSSLRMFQAAAFPRLPFYDTRLADFFSTVPSAFMIGRRLQIDYLKRFAPDLARVKWQPYDANLYNYQHYDSWLLPRRAAKKAWRFLAGQKTIERNWEVQFGGESGQAGLRHWLLRPGLRLHDLVSKKKIAALLESFRKEPLKQGRGYTVSMLLTFSAWLELESGPMIECHG